MPSLCDRRTFLLLPSRLLKCPLPQATWVSGSTALSKEPCPLARSCTCKHFLSSWMQMELSSEMYRPGDWTRVCWGWGEAGWSG